MIDHRQIRAARALLNWSQTDLARASNLATSSIKNVESETGAARKETLHSIQAALDDAGIELLPGSGVRLRNECVTIVQGRSATPALLDSIYQHSHTSSDRSVCIIGLDEQFSVQSDGAKVIEAHIARLKAAGICERILVRDGDTHFLNDPDCYRWLPPEYFTRNAPLYIYGGKVAIHIGSLRRRTIIIDAPALADHLRKLFELAWQTASRHPVASPVRAGGSRR